MSRRFSVEPPGLLLLLLMFAIMLASFCGECVIDVALIDVDNSFAS